jgi:hypothetical protein
MIFSRLFKRVLTGAAVLAALFFIFGPLYANFQTHKYFFDKLRQLGAKIEQGMITGVIDKNTKIDSIY